MIQIIKEGTKNITKCSVCGCVFSYEKEDVMSFSLIHHIHCPQCNNDIFLTDGKNGR